MDEDHEKLRSTKISELNTYNIESDLTKESKEAKESKKNNLEILK